MIPDAKDLVRATAESDALHERVRAFASRFVDYHGISPATQASQADEADREFEALALDIVAFQTGTRPPDMAALLLEAVPADCFRFASIFRFPRSHARTSFVTSGTTGRASGVHPMRVVETYEHLSLLGGQAGLGLDPNEGRPPIVLALASWTGTDTSSSLGYMMQRFMERFDGRALSAQRDAGNFRLDQPERWLVSPQGVDVASLQGSVDLAFQNDLRVILLATSFALVSLLDELGERTCPLPPGSVVMQTGGFKGRTRTLSSLEMQQALLRVFGDVEVVGEYGMTELSSQLYERPPAGSARMLVPGVYYEPAWMRVVVCDPVTLRPVPDGDIGLACFIDLGNVDSAAVVLTQDRVRREAGGVRLLGRLTGAPLRGCSLSVEALLARDGLRGSQVSPLVGGEETPGCARVNDALVGDDRALLEARARLDRLLPVTRQVARSLQLNDGPGARPFAASGVEELARASGLSVEGVRLAVKWSLELQPTSAEIDQLLASVAATREACAADATVWVILSATVFTAAHRALALALAVSSDVRVKPSRRTPHFVNAMYACDPELFHVVDSVCPRPGDHVFAYGSDETLVTLRDSLPQGVTLHGHGHGIGVALVGPGADPSQAARDLALDMVLFDQQGCLSPRLALVHPQLDVEPFIQALVESLSRWECEVPRGPLPLEALSAIAWSERVARTLAPTWTAGKGWVADYSDAVARGYSVPLAEACRAISVARVLDPERGLMDIAPLITCVGCVGEPEYWKGLRASVPQARVVPLGQMQRPALDGPVDRRRRSDFGSFPP